MPPVACDELDRRAHGVLATLADLTQVDEALRQLLLGNTWATPFEREVDVGVLLLARIDRGSQPLELRAVTWHWQHVGVQEVHLLGGCLSQRIGAQRLAAIEVEDVDLDPHVRDRRVCHQRVRGAQLPHVNLDRIGWRDGGVDSPQRLVRQKRDVERGRLASLLAREREACVDVVASLAEQRLKVEVALGNLAVGAALLPPTSRRPAASHQNEVHV